MNSGRVVGKLQNTERVKKGNLKKNCLEEEVEGGWR